MHIGRLLCAAGGGSTSVLTDWMSRQADNGVFTVELIIAVDAEISVAVFHKDSEATGEGSSAGTIVSSNSTPGLKTATISGLKEMVRYQIVVEGTEENLGGVVYRDLPVTWFDTARV
jgi:hypothetical protein